MTTQRPRLIAFMNAYSQGKSGGDMVFIEIAKRVRDYEKVIITSWLGKKLCQENGLKGKYLITSGESEFRYVIWVYIKRTIKAFFLRLKPKKGDIFLGTSDFLPDVLPIFLLKIRNPKTKWIQHIFHLIPSSRRIPFFAQRLSLFLIKRYADLVVVDNSLLGDDLVKLGFGRRKTFVNYPGINLDYLKTVRANKNKGYEGIFMAQLRPSKGIFDLVKIWRLVCKELPTAKLGIIGKGSKEILSKIKGTIKKNRLEKNIDLLGYLEDEKAFITIKKSKIFVFPSYEEGFGIAGLEAQALGLPVIAWRLPVFEEIFPKGMIKLKIGRTKEFAKGVVGLLKNKKLYRRLSKEAVENAQRFDWNKTAKRELGLIENLIK